MADEDTKYKLRRKKYNTDYLKSLSVEQLEKRKLYHKEYNDFNKERRKILEINDRNTYPEKYLYRNAKYRASKSNLEFNIELSDIRIPEYCPVLGIKLKCGYGPREDASASLDRILNDKGYIKGNIQVISHRANTLKRDGTLRELKMLVSYMEKTLVQ